MSRVTKAVASWLMVGGLCVACGGAQSEPTAPSTAEPASAPPPAQAPSGARPAMTAQECEAAGGTVVGDIGDGAVHRPEYLCASGVAPTGSISSPEGAPMAVEGSVCCPN